MELSEKIKNKDKTRPHLLHLLETGSEEGGGGGGGGGETGFRERKCDLSQDFPAFGPSVLVEARSKVDLRYKSYAWTLILWSSDNFKR